MSSTSEEFIRVGPSGIDIDDVLRDMERERAEDEALFDVPDLIGPEEPMKNEEQQPGGAGPAQDTKSSAGPGAQLCGFGETEIVAVAAATRTGFQEATQLLVEAAQAEAKGPPGGPKLKEPLKMFELDHGKIKLSMCHWLDACKDVTKWCMLNREDDSDRTYFHLREIVQSLYEAWTKAHGKGPQLAELDAKAFEARKQELNELTKSAHMLPTASQFAMLFECMGLAFHSVCTTNKVDWELQSVLDTIRKGVFCYGRRRPAGEILWFETMIAEHKKVKYSQGKPQILDTEAVKRAKVLLATTLKDCYFMREEGKVTRPRLEETAWRIKYGWKEGHQETALMKIEGKEYFSAGLDMVLELGVTSLGAEVPAVIIVQRDKNNCIKTWIRRTTDKFPVDYLAAFNPPPPPPAEAPKQEGKKAS